jgi:hypothetical protein
MWNCITVRFQRQLTLSGGYTHLEVVPSSPETPDKRACVYRLILAVLRQILLHIPPLVDLATLHFHVHRKHVPRLARSAFDPSITTRIPPLPSLLGVSESAGAEFSFSTPSAAPTTYTFSRGPRSLSSMLSFC